MTLQQPHLPADHPPSSRQDRASIDSAPPVEDALGLYLREIRQTTLLSAEQERALADLLRVGDLQAWRDLVVANLPLVVSIARRYQGYGLELLDLLQEGAFGLMRAAMKFDPRRGRRFSTLAVWWIRAAIRVALANQGRTIRLPVAQIEKQQRITRTQAQISHESGVVATLEEIADALELGVDDVQRILLQAQHLFSLDASLADEGADPLFLAEVLDDPKAVEALDLVEEQVSGLTIQQILCSLSDRQRQVLILHLGLDGEDPLPLRDIGEKLGITGERVRQIEVRTLRFLRASEEGRQLWEYLRGNSSPPRENG